MKESHSHTYTRFSQIKLLNAFSSFLRAIENVKIVFCALGE